MSIEVNIRKHFKGFQLNINFNNVTGRMGILGSSGCGKSMTLKCIAGVVRPDSGRIVLNDRVLFDSAQHIDLKPQQRRVGYLFQNYALLPHMRVIDNIACGLNLGKQEARSNQRIRELIELLRLTGLEERYPAQISGGQQQRVALARILAYEPEIILLDEPFSALDEYLKEQLQLQLSCVLDIWGDNIIMVTHNRDEVYKFCDNLLVMDNGQTISLGRTQELFEHPDMAQTARLTGCKNVSTARRLDEHHIYAEEWDLTLVSSAPVTEDISAVGIRAHSFYPAQSDETNAISVTVCEIGRNPFDYDIIFTTGGARELWWKLPRQNIANTTAVQPDYLTVHPDDVLLLR